MKHFNKTLCFLFLALIANPFQSQGQAAILALIFGDKVASEEFNISLELGGGFASYSNLPGSEFAGTTFDFGIGLNRKINENFYFTPAIYFVSRRQAQVASYSLDSGNPDLDALFTNDQTRINLNYIDVPLIFSYQTNSGKMRYSAGAQMSFRGNVTADLTIDEGTFNQGFKKYTNSFDWGPIAEVAFNMQAARKGKGLLIRARYYQGLNDIFKDNFTPNNVRNSGFVVMLSLPFVTDEIAKGNLERYKKKKKKKK